MNSLKEKIEWLRDYLAKRDDVLMAFIFGSYAQNQEIAESDFDIAIYLRPEGRKDKVGQDITIDYYKNVDTIRAKATEIVEKEIDLVCINDAPASLVSNIIKTGIPLIIKDKKLYWDIYLKISLEAEDFWMFAKEYFEIYQKAKSLIPEQKTRLLERIQFLEDELKEIEEFRKLTFEEYQTNKAKRRNIERWTENIINAAIDAAKIILASEKQKMPKSYEEALRNFGILAGLSEENAKNFSKFANLRNILAHEYLDILYERIQNFIMEFPPLYKKIAAFWGKYLSDISE